MDKQTNPNPKNGLGFKNNSLWNIINWSKNFTRFSIEIRSIKFKDRDMDLGGIYLTPMLDKDKTSLKSEV